MVKRSLLFAFVVLAAVKVCAIIDTHPLKTQLLQKQTFKQVLAYVFQRTSTKAHTFGN